MILIVVDALFEIYKPLSTGYNVEMLLQGLFLLTPLAVQDISFFKKIKEILYIKVKANAY